MTYIILRPTEQVLPFQSDSGKRYAPSFLYFGGDCRPEDARYLPDALIAGARRSGLLRAAISDDAPTEYPRTMFLRAKLSSTRARSKSARESGVAPHG